MCLKIALVRENARSVSPTISFSYLKMQNSPPGRNLFLCPPPRLSTFENAPKPPMDRRTMFASAAFSRDIPAVSLGRDGAGSEVSTVLRLASLTV